MYPGMFRPGSSRSGTGHAYVYEDPVFDPYLARSFRPSHQTPRDVYANSAYEDHLYHRQPQQLHGYREPQNFPSDCGLIHRTRQAPHRHLAEFEPGYVDLRFLPAFTLGLGSGPSARQQAAGAARHSQQGLPGPQARPNARQVRVEDNEFLPYDVLTSQFPGVSSRHAHPPSVRASSCHAASQRSEADLDEDSRDRDQNLQDLTYDQRWVRRQQQAEEQLLRQQRAQDQEHRLAQQARERRLQEEQERRLAQHLHEKRLAEEEQERRLAYQHMQKERLQQLLYQRRREQEIAEEELRLFEAAQRQDWLQQQRQGQQQRQQQLAEAFLQQQREEQESQRQQKLKAALLQQRHQQQQSRNTQQAKGKTAAGEPQEASQQLQLQQQQQQQQTDSEERVKGRASIQQPPDDATTIIHKLMRSNSVRAEQPMLEQLSKANTKLTELSEGLRAATSCVSAIKAEESGLPAKLKQCQGQLESPEQLQKRLVELGERGMQIVLSMDELHSENDKVRSLRKRIVKKALVLMEDIDNVKSNMLHSILVHANDDQSEFSMPASGAVSEASEAAEEEDEQDDVKHESSVGSSAESDHSQGDQTLQQVADALAGLKVAGEAVLAPTAEQQPKNPEVVDGGIVGN